MTQDDVPSRFTVDFTGATLLGIYRVEHKIADGGMGSVWLGEDTNLGRKVVVKVPHVRFLGEPGFRARFTREINELVRLEHPHIVRILAQGTHDEIPFFVLQYLGGGSLEKRLEAGDGVPRGADVVAPWLRTVAATLDFIHGRGVVHRDVKPENILFDEEGHVFLSDFGVVKALDEDLDVTDAGAAVGSPKYMAPEQALGGPVEGAADQYGLATALYELISGRLPFDGDSPLEVLLNKQQEPPTPLADLAPELPAACSDAVMRGLAIDPAKRFPSCQAFADAFLAGAGILEGTPPTGVKAPKTSRRGLLAVAILAAVVIVVGFVSGWFSPARTEKKGAFVVQLLSPGAEPRRILRYHPEPGAEEKMTVRIATEESRQRGDEEPTISVQPSVGLRIGLKVTKVGRNDEIAFAWECLGMTLDDADLPPELVSKRGSARQTALGVNLEFHLDSPPPEDPGTQLLVALMTEIVEQTSNPLPAEPVGIGARWEVTNSRNHIEGVRITQTLTFELESLEGNEARLRMYIAVSALNQAFEHPDIPAHVTARMMRVHGDGEGAGVIDLDRLGDRSSWMTIETRGELSWTDADEKNELTLVRTIRYESERE